MLPSVVLAGLLHLAPPIPPAKQAEKAQSNHIVSIPDSGDSLNVMFVAAKGERIYKILSFPAFQKELDKCILLRVDLFENRDGVSTFVFRCEEAQ